MAYAFDFGAVFDYSGQLAQGAAFTLGLTAAGAVLGGAIGVAGGVCRAWRIAPLNWLFKLYVEAIRNTPLPGAADVRVLRPAVAGPAAQ